MSLSHEVIEITCKALTTGLGHLKKKERKKERNPQMLAVANMAVTRLKSRPALGVGF